MGHLQSQLNKHIIQEWNNRGTHVIHSDMTINIPMCRNCVNCAFLKACSCHVPFWEFHPCDWSRPWLCQLSKRVPLTNRTHSQTLGHGWPRRLHLYTPLHTIYPPISPFHPYTQYALLLLVLNFIDSGRSKGGGWWTGMITPLELVPILKTYAKCAWPGPITRGCFSIFRRRMTSRGQCPRGCVCLWMSSPPPLQEILYPRLIDLHL